MKNFKFRLKTKIRHRIRLNKRVIDFNKEILIGEIGALVCASIFGFIGSLISKSPNFISIATVIGSAFGGCVSWLITRIYDEKKYKTFSVKKLTKDISFYTPIAFLIAVLVSYPIIILVTHSLFIKEHISYLSSFLGELSGFGVFLILINTYRYILSRFLNRLL
jgi:membrane protein YqaA with SNARE-associated domain